VTHAETTRCTAELTHAHGTSQCILATGHEDQHRSPCDSCVENDGYDDPSDHLTWDQHRENWLRTSVIWGSGAV